MRGASLQAAPAVSDVKADVIFQFDLTMLSFPVFKSFRDRLTVQEHSIRVVTKALYHSYQWEHSFSVGDFSPVQGCSNVLCNDIV